MSVTAAAYKDMSLVLGQPVYLAKSYKVTAGSTSATLLSLVQDVEGNIPDVAGGVMLYAEDVVRINPDDAAASAANGQIPIGGFYIPGTKEVLSAIQLYAASDTEVTVLIYNKTQG